MTDTDIDIERTYEAIADDEAHRATYSLEEINALWHARISAGAASLTSCSRCSVGQGSQHRANVPSARRILVKGLIGRQQNRNRNKNDTYKPRA